MIDTVKKAVPVVVKRQYWKFLDWESTRRQRRNQLTLNPTGQTQPCFLVGCQRSGTNMLVNIFKAHHEVEVFNEGEDRAFDHCRLRSLEIIGKVADSCYARIALFKPITDTHRLMAMLDCYEGSKAFFAFRHYHDVTNSQVRAFGKLQRAQVQRWLDTNFAEYGRFRPTKETRDLVKNLWDEAITQSEGAALFWLVRCSLYFDLEFDRDERVMPVIYEEVVKKAEQRVRDMCSFIGCAFDSARISNIFQTSVGRYAQPRLSEPIEVACEGLWRRIQEHCKEVKRTS